MANYLNSFFLTLLALTVFCIGIFFLVAVLVSGSDTKITAASALIIAGAAIFTAAIKFHSEERDRAFKFLTENAGNKDLLDALGFIGKLRGKNGDFSSTKAKKIYKSSHSIDQITVKNVLSVYNFFEELSIGVKNNQINEAIVKDFYIGMLCRFYQTTNTFLPIFRNIPRAMRDHPMGNIIRPDMFVNVDWLYLRWIKNYDELMPLEEGEYKASWAQI